jgi:Alr-MurF fusion protein
LGLRKKTFQNSSTGLRNYGFEVASVFSHLAASDDPSHDAFTFQQIEVFDHMCAQLKHGLGYGFLKHILNTAGISRFPQAQYDMVRLGIGLYGISNLADEQAFLEHVSTLKASSRKSNPSKRVQPSVITVSSRQ